MKKIVTFFTFWCSLLSCTDSNQDSSNSSLESTDSLVEIEINTDRTLAVDFNNEMTFMQEGILELVNALFQSDSATIDQHLENCKFEIEMNMQKLISYDSDTSKTDFVNNMIDLMQFYQKEFSSSFLEVVTIIKKTELNEEDRQKLSAYDAVFATKEKGAFDKVFISQEAYAKTNNISLNFQE